MGLPIPSSEVASGALLGNKYRLVRLIGRGAFGSVYEAEHAQLGRRCAIKVLHGGFDFPQSQQRFEREARALARLEHENIVSLIDAGEDATAGQYLVLEFISGPTLRSVLPSMKGASPRRVLDIVLQVARGLGHAHAAGIVHRDLKPENVMLASHADGQLLVKILDFGIARLFDADQERLTMTGAALGTAAYMAPEQARGDRDVDRRVDVYALGVIVYEALAGVRPFEGESYNETLFRILSTEHVPLSQHRPDVAPAVCEVVERALAKDRDRRFAEVEDFARAFADAVRATSPASSDLDSGERTLNVVAPRVEESRPPEGGGSRPERRFTIAAMAGSTVAGAALGFLLAMSWRAPRTAPSTSEQRAPISSVAPSASSVPGSAAASSEPESTLAAPAAGVTASESAAPPRHSAPVMAGVAAGVTPVPSTTARLPRGTVPRRERPVEAEAKPTGRKDRGF